VLDKASMQEFSRYGTLYMLQDQSGSIVWFCMTMFASIWRYWFDLSLVADNYVKQVKVARATGVGFAGVAAAALAGFGIDRLNSSIIRKDQWLEYLWKAHGSTHVLLVLIWNIYSQNHHKFSEVQSPIHRGRPTQ
jgi:hypothetical protein